MDKDSTAPDPAMLRQLRGMIPGMAANLHGRKIGGKGRKVLQPMPTKVCNVCGSAFGQELRDKPVEFRELKLTESCDICAQHLKDGHTAFVAGTMFAWVKIPDGSKIADMIGKVITLKPDSMEQIRRHFQLEWAEKANPNPPPDAPPSPEKPA